MEQFRVSTEGVRGRQRVELVRATAFDMFNLEVDFGADEPDSVQANIGVQQAASVSVVEVRTSWSIVRRTKARAAAATADHLLLYFVGQGGSTFRNARGDEFRTRQGSLILGSQAAPYTAAAAPGRDWQFRTTRVNSDRLPLCGETIRRSGFQMLPENSSMAMLASDYVRCFSTRCDTFTPLQLDAALQAMDTLLAAALGDQAAVRNDGGEALQAARFATSLGYIERWLHHNVLSPELVARHVGVSTRQLHRIFAREGTGIALEIRKARVKRAQVLLVREPAQAVTDVALASGFDSLPTFYRSFRAVAGMTATEWRCDGSV